MTVQRAILASIVFLVAACSSSAPPDSAARSTSVGASSPAPTTQSADASSQQTQTSDGGQVTVVVDWAGPASGAAFEVTLDTHSVDLDALDLTDATLQNDRGEMLTPVPGTRRRAATIEKAPSRSLAATCRASSRAPSGSR